MWWWWSGYHWWWPGMVVMGMLMVICGVLMARMMRVGVGGGMGGMCGSWWRRPGWHATDAPEQLLDERLARGEIDIDITEYRRIQEALAGSSSPAKSEHAGDQR